MGGIMIGIGGSGTPGIPYGNYYGVEFDTAFSTPSCTRVGRKELHQSLPIQSMMRRCIVADDGTVVTYLQADDSTKTDTGADADLSGALGQVMVEIPKHYRKFEIDGTKRRVLLSMSPLPGYHEVPRMFVSAYEASLDRTANKLSSVVNMTEQYRGGNNTSSWDGTYRSLLGKPATSIPFQNYRTYAHNRGAGWQAYTYECHKAIYWLFVVEYATLNSQEAFTAELDENGYHKGGLGPGCTTVGDWGTYNSYNPLLNCGWSNKANSEAEPVLGNFTGIKTITTEDNGGGLSFTIEANSYRGIENPFGHVWKWMDGCMALIAANSEAEPLSKLYTCDNPEHFASTLNEHYMYRGNLPRANGYGKTHLFGEFGEFPFASTGGSSTTYLCDYFYTSLPDSGVSTRALLVGGGAHDGATAGLVCVYSSSGFASASADCGSRLCYLG